MTSLARRCDLILALIDALLEEGETAPPNATCGAAPEIPSRSHSALGEGEPAFEEDRVATEGPVKAS